MKKAPDDRIKAAGGWGGWKVEWAEVRVRVLQSRHMSNGSMPTDLSTEVRE